MLVKGFSLFLLLKYTIIFLFLYFFLPTKLFVLWAA